jgi:processive 1,2-diacylglycerol beta-glucosyltransferase
VQEAIAAKCPLIINQVIPGQEDGNARIVEESGFGALADGKKEVARWVEEAG